MPEPTELPSNMPVAIPLIARKGIEEFLYTAFKSGFICVSSCSGIPYVPAAYKMGKLITPPLMYLLPSGTLLVVAAYGSFGAYFYLRLHDTPLQGFTSAAQRHPLRSASQELLLMAASWVSLGPMVSLSIVVNGVTTAALAISLLPLLTDLGLRMLSMKVVGLVRVDRVRVVP